MKTFFNRKGFTLVELCVVIAIIAIIGTMVTTTIVFVSKQNSDVRKEASFIADVTDIQKNINDWLKKYDSAGYQIKHTSNQSSLKATKGGETVTLTFSDSEKKLKVGSADASGKYENVSDVTFQVIEDKNGENIEGKVAQIVIEAKKGSGTETQKLIFPLFSNKARQRSVTGKNG